MARFPYTRISSVDIILPNFLRFKYHPLIKIGLLNNSNFIKVEAYIDTGSQWCLFNNDLARQLGIKDYKNTKYKEVTLAGIGGKSENKAYFHDLKLEVFKDSKNLNSQNAWVVNTQIGFLDVPIGFAGILGAYGFLDRFSFKVNIPEGYFEIEAIFE